MDFHIPCPCGQGIAVTEGAAERIISCSCGRTISVPPLTELRRQAGLPPYNVSPEMMIEYLLQIGQFPNSKICVQCGAGTEDNIQVLTECERIWRPKKGVLFWIILFLGTVLSPIKVLYWEREEQEEYGKEKVYSLPLPICQKCQPALRSRKAIMRGLHKIPEYSRLLDKFPDAKVAVQ